MPAFIYHVVVTTDTQAHADRVITERIDYDERLYESGSEDSPVRGKEIQYTIEQG